MSRAEQSQRSTAQGASIATAYGQMKGDGILGEVDGFRVRLVTAGMQYGFENCLTNSFCEPLVEFYSFGWAAQGERGQFVSRYMLSTLLDRDENVGLQLDVSNPSQHVSPSGMKQVLEWACSVVPMVKNHVGLWRVSYAA